MHPGFPWGQEVTLWWGSLVSFNLTPNYSPVWGLIIPKSIPVIMCSIWHLQKAELASCGRCWSFSPCLFCLVYTSLSSWKSQTGITKPSATQLTDQPCFDESAFWLYDYSSSQGFPLIPLWYLIVLFRRSVAGDRNLYFVHALR